MRNISEEELVLILKKKKKEVKRVMEICDRHLINAPQEDIRIAGRQNCHHYYKVFPKTKNKDKKNDYVGEKNRKLYQSQAIQMEDIVGEELKREEYISKKDEKTLRSLFQKKYSKKLKKELSKQYDILDKLLENYQEDVYGEVYKNFPEVGKGYIRPYVLPYEQKKIKWMNDEKGEMNPMINNTEYYSDKGEHMRSKSEMIIANKLYALGIPYVYESELQLADGQVIYPDFKLYSVERDEVMYWEHLGMMDEPEYAEKNVKRVQELAMNGIIQGKNLILSFETKKNQLYTKVIDRMIFENLY